MMNDDLHPNDGLLNEYLDDALLAPERSIIQAHLVGCSDCRRRAGRLERVFSALAALPDEQPAGDIAAAVNARLQLTPQVFPLRIWAVQVVLLLVLTGVVWPFLSARGFAFKPPQWAAAWSTWPGLAVQRAASVIADLHTAAAELSLSFAAAIEPFQGVLDSLQMTDGRPALPAPVVIAILAALSALWWAGNVYLVRSAPFEPRPPRSRRTQS